MLIFEHLSTSNNMVFNVEKLLKNGVDKRMYPDGKYVFWEI
jgi:hypothetical protein